MTDRDAVVAAQQRFDDAELRDDRAALDDLIDAVVLSIGPKGFVLDKAQWIARHDHFRYHELDVDDCIFVGDRPIDAEAASAAGMASALLREEPSGPVHRCHRLDTLDDLRPLLNLEPA